MPQLAGDDSDQLGAVRGLRRGGQPRFEAAFEIGFA